MLKVVDNHELLTILSGYNTSGELMHPYMNVKGNHKGKFMYSITDGTLYRSINLKDLIKLLLDGKFDNQGTIRMRSAHEPKAHGNPGCAPNFDKSLLKSYYSTL